MLFAELLTWSLLPTFSSFYNSVKFEGSDCGFANVSTRKVAGHIWEYQEFYDCYDSDTVNILALPGSQLGLEKCAKNCLDDTNCTGFNFPRGHLGPDNGRFCFLKFRGDNKSTEDGVQCKNGRQTRYYDFYSGISINCSDKAVPSDADVYGEKLLKAGNDVTEEGLRKAPTLPPPVHCREENIMYEPLNMDDLRAIQYVDNVTDCQDACRAMKGCGFYTYYPSLKMCHHASPMAVKVKTGKLFQGGPASCSHSGGQGAQNITVQNTMLRAQCMTNNSYVPLMGRGRPGKKAADPIACQQQCEETEWCATFVYNVLLHLCFLQEKGAKPTGSVALQISGPKTCYTQFVFYMRIKLVSEEVQDLEKKKAIISGVLQAATQVTFSTYHPYDGNNPGKPQALVSMSELKLKILNVTSKNVFGKVHEAKITHTNITVHVGMQLDPQRALYAARLFKASNVTKTIQKNCDALMPGTNNQIEKDLGLGKGTNLWVAKVFGAHIDRLEPGELFDESMPGQGSAPARAVMEYGRNFFAITAMSVALAAVAWTWRQKPRCTGVATSYHMPRLRPAEYAAAELFLCRGNGECGGEQEIQYAMDIEALEVVKVTSETGVSIHSVFHQEDTGA